MGDKELETQDQNPLVRRRGGGLFVKDKDPVGAAFEEEVIGAVVGDEFEFCDFSDQVDRQVSITGDDRLGY
jgi:hypothetical protein